jgi:hypothetical protein
LNSEFTVAQAGRFAQRLAREAGDDPAAKVRRAYLLALAREPSDQEQTEAVAFVAGQRGHYGDAAEADSKAWADFCQMLMASSAFLYLE